MAAPEQVLLPERLKQLRLGHWPGLRLTQPELGLALGVGASSVSSWESVIHGKIPSPQRLGDYASFFATRRSVQSNPPRVLDAAELTDAEKAERERLASELARLREQLAGVGDDSSGRPRGLWHFPDAGPVRLICGRIPTRSRPKYSSEVELNYMQLTGYADLDALVELFGHIRAQNPTADVRFALDTRIESDDLQTHLVMLGSSMTNPTAGYMAGRVGLPVRQMSDPKFNDGEIFEIGGPSPSRLYPVFLDGDRTKPLLEDVGLFYRTTNPLNSARTLTFCSGVFARGVYGAVRCLTDAAFRDRNEAHIAARFGEVNSFGLLMRVPVVDHATGTPDLSDDRVILRAWPEER